MFPSRRPYKAVKRSNSYLTHDQFLWQIHP
jgi:hypothetical protein